MKSSGKLGMAVLLAGMSFTATVEATECCVLNPNLKLYFQSPDCTTDGSVTKCPSIVKEVVNKVNLLGFLDEEVAGEAFPRDAFVYVCPIALDGFVPESGMSFVRTKDQRVNVDVTPYLKFLVDFEELIWQGTYDDATSAERSKDLFPFVIQLSGVQGGFTNLRVIGLGQESYNAKPIQDGAQKVSANVQGNVVGDPDNGNFFKGNLVLADGHPVCTTKETFDRE